MLLYEVKYYSDIKWKEILPFVTIWMDPDGIVLNEVCQKEKDKYSMISFVFGRKQSHRNRKEVVNRS